MALYSSECMAPSQGFGRTGGRDGLWSEACPETYIASGSDSEAHSGPCYKGLGQASLPLRSGASGYALCALCRSSGYSRSNSSIKPSGSSTG